LTVHTRPKMLLVPLMRRTRTSRVMRCRLRRNIKLDVNCVTNCHTRRSSHTTLQHNSLLLTRTASVCVPCAAPDTSAVRPPVRMDHPLCSRRPCITGLTARAPVVPSSHIASHTTRHFFDYMTCGCHSGMSSFCSVSHVDHLCVDIYVACFSQCYMMSARPPPRQLKSKHAML